MMLSNGKVAKLPDKELTDAEIVKALEELLKELKGKKQLIVPEQGVKNLCYGLQNFLDLINRQNAEIDDLKTENLILSQKRFNIFERIEYTEKLKNNAYKEFANELKCRTHEISYNTMQVVNKDDIDNLLKELVGDSNVD